MPMPIDGKIYDFDEFSYLLTDHYDEDNGSNINSEGKTDYDPSPEPEPDDGRFNFGEDGNPDDPCTAVGDWDFGLPWGEEVMSIPGTYDFNRLSNPESSWFVAGADFELENTPLYANYTSKTAEKLVDGLYFVYDSIVANGKVRMCKSPDFVGVSCGYSGWFSTADLINLGKPSINDYVSLTGTMYKNSHGINGSVVKEDAKYYIVDIIDGDEYPYALGEDILSTPIGYAKEEDLTILERNSSRRQASKRKRHDNA